MNLRGRESVDLKPFTGIASMCSFLAEMSTSCFENKEEGAGILGHPRSHFVGRTRTAQSPDPHAQRPRERMQMLLALCHRFVTPCFNHVFQGIGETHYEQKNMLRPWVGRDKTTKRPVTKSHKQADSWLPLLPSRSGCRGRGARALSQAAQHAPNPAFCRGTQQLL